MTQALVVIGAGGFGREVLDVIEAINHEHAMVGSPAFDVLGVLDDSGVDDTLLIPYDVKHLGPIALLHDMPTTVGYVIGIGSPFVRANIDARFTDQRESPVLIHPSATMGARVEVGGGSVVCAGARLTNHIRLGRQVHVNLNSTVGHDATLGDYTTLSPLVAVSGKVTMGERVFVGTGAVVNPGVKIGADAVIGSGAAVLRNVDAGVTSVGVPARAR